MMRHEQSIRLPTIILHYTGIQMSDKYTEMPAITNDPLKYDINHDLHPQT